MIPRQVHNPEGVTEPPPPGYRLAYLDEVPSGFHEGFGWLFWSGMNWVKCYDDGETQSGIGVPSWSYAVPVDWVRPKTAPELHAEIAALRAEVAELKRHLNPPVAPETVTDYMKIPYAQKQVDEWPDVIGSGGNP